MTTRGKWLDYRLNKSRTVLKSKLTSDASDDDVPRCFQISVNILEGKRLAWNNLSEATSYVMVGLDKVKYRTSVRQNMKVPYYKENFVFELFMTAGEVQQNCVWLSVMEPRCCGTRLLGEASVDLAYVWRQPYHTMTHRWVQLTLPNDSESSPVGYLKVDISIAVRSEVLKTHCETQDVMEGNILLPPGSEQQPASYQVTVYRAYNVPCNANDRPDMLSNPPNTSLRVTFCDLTGKSSTHCRSNDPMYLERVSIVEMFPNVCDTIQIEVMNGGPSVIASTKLKLSQISHKGENGFLPTFGPSLLHMYGPWAGSSEDGPYYRGSLLVSMKTLVPYYKRSVRSVTVEPVTACGPDTEWIFEDFIMFCPILEVSMLDRRVSGSACGVAITVGEIPFSSSVDQESRKLHYTGSMGVQWYSPSLGGLKLDTFPVLQLALRFPDFRFRMYRNNVLQSIVTELEKNLTNTSTRLVKGDYGHIKDLLESLCYSKEETATKILKFLEIAQLLNRNEEIQKYRTELDLKLTHLQEEKITKIYRRIVSRETPIPHLYKGKRCDDGDYKKMMKLMWAECRTIMQDLKKLIFKIPDGWPVISVWLLNSSSRVAYAKISPSDVIHSAIPEQCGQRCGKIQTVYLKPIKCPDHPTASDCYCISGKIELMAWMGLFRQRTALQSYLPGYFVNSEGIECELMNLECSVNIYRAKLICPSDVTNGLSPFVRVHFMSDVRDTQVQQHTMNPIWNEVLRIYRSANTSSERLANCSPEIMVEVYCLDAIPTSKISLLGRLTMTPAFLNNPNPPPPLEWFDIQIGTEHVGKIQMSAQIIQVPETVVNSTCNHPQKRTHNSTCEPLPVELLPVNNTYKIDVYWWGLRDISITHKPRMSIEIEDLVIKSGVITEFKRNCNFPNDRVTRIFQGNLSNGCSPLTVKLYESTTFGRTVFAGLNVVKKSQKYLVNWIPKDERKDILFSGSIAPNVFMQVGRRTFLKRQPPCLTVQSSEESVRNQEEIPKSNRIWGKFFPKKIDEEELMLLPVFSKEIKKVSKKLEDDWWMRYYATLNKIFSEHVKPSFDVIAPKMLEKVRPLMMLQNKASGDDEPTGDQMTIYDSELEAQPGFCRFTDWCSTIKIYSGNKSGIPETDEQLRCGYLKASIAIYLWPPPDNTVAVSSSGVNLDRGYFNSHPDNDPARYVVRVYVVKCSGLVTRGFSAGSKCYVSVQCNSRQLGDSGSGVPRSAEPVFGKVYELCCNFPEDYLLKVSVMDSGPTSPDDLIGCTSIDLENRAYTKHRATVGMPSEYNINGPSKWRDSQRPSAILEELCAKNHLPPPTFPDASTVLLNGAEYKDTQPGTKYTSPLVSKESICLSILQNWHQMPMCGHKLVPQHVESRTLYDPEKPGIEQGKIHMWVDMFALNTGRSVPAPVDITPKPAADYELRVVVWSVQGLKLTKRSNIYVRAWIGPSDEAQDTDIYCSVNGEGHFNWRMIFQFQYKHTERKLVVQEKNAFTEIVELFPPILIVEILDVDAPNPEDFIGTLMLDLSAMPRGVRLAQQCTPDAMRRQKVDMFLVRSLRSWWPLKMINMNTGNYYFAGAIDLEITLMPREKAMLMPAGFGRHPPVPLPDPKYPMDTNASDCSIVTCNRQRMPVAVALGLLCFGACVYWDLPAFVFDSLNVLGRSRDM